MTCQFYLRECHWEHGWVEVNSTASIQIIPVLQFPSGIYDSAPIYVQILGLAGTLHCGWLGIPLRSSVSCGSLTV